MINETMLESGWSLFIASDVTALRASERGLRPARDIALKSAQTGPLTGVSNRRQVMNQMELVISQGETVSACACLLNIDHFKSVNDQFGHQVGDTVLTSFARTIQRSIRVRDSFGRVGGEEFLLILTDLTADMAAPRIASILNAVRIITLPGMPPDFRVTCSGGLTQIRPVDTLAEVFGRCDAALYSAKHSGRDQIVADQG